MDLPEGNNSPSIALSWGTDRKGWVGGTETDSSQRQDWDYSVGNFHLQWVLEPKGKGVRMLSQRSRDYHHLPKGPCQPRGFDTTVTSTVRKTASTSPCGMSKRIYHLCLGQV